MNRLILTTLALLLVAQTGWTAEKTELKDQNDKINYSIGYQIGSDFSRQGLNLQSDVLVQGIRDALAKGETLITPQEMNQVLVALKDKIVAEQREMQNQAGLNFLETYRNKDGVTELPEGVMYREMVDGKGESPTEKDTVNIHYITRNILGTEVGSTYSNDQPATYVLSKMVPGLRDVLMLMQVGDKWEVVVPLGKLNNPEKNTPGQGVLIYEIELLSINNAPEE